MLKTNARKEHDDVTFSIRAFESVDPRGKKRIAPVTSDPCHEVLPIPGENADQRSVDASLMTRALTHQQFSDGGIRLVEVMGIRADALPQLEIGAKGDHGTYLFNSSRMMVAACSCSRERPSAWCKRCMPYLLSMRMLLFNAGWYPNPSPVTGTAMMGILRPVYSHSSPTARVSVMPNAHLFKVLNVTGKAMSASARGKRSGASGRLYWLRTGKPVIFSSKGISRNVVPWGVVITHTFHWASCAVATNAGTDCARGEPQEII